MIFTKVIHLLRNDDVLTGNSRYFKECDVFGSHPHGASRSRAAGAFPGGASSLQPEDRSSWEEQAAALERPTRCVSVPLWPDAWSSADSSSLSTRSTKSLCLCKPSVQQSLSLWVSEAFIMFFIYTAAYLSAFIPPSSLGTSCFLHHDLFAFSLIFLAFPFFLHFNPILAILSLPLFSASAVFVASWLQLDPHECQKRKRWWVSLFKFEL